MIERIAFWLTSILFGGGLFVGVLLAIYWLGKQIILWGISG